MTKDEAIHFFDLNTDFQSIELLDSVDEMLFNLKNEVLQKLYSPLLLEKRKQQCAKIIVAQEALQMREDVAVSKYTPLSQHADAISFLEEYEHLLSALKLSIFNAKYPQTLLEGIQAAIDLQRNYAHQFLSIFAAFQKSETEVLSQETLDTGVLLRQLKTEATHSESSAMIEKELARIYKLLLVEK